MSVAEFEGRRVLQEAPQGLWNDAWSRLRRNPSALVGFVLVGIFTAMAIFAPIIAPYGPREVVAPLTDAFQSPSLDHWAGLDQQSRDEWSRIVWGARYSLVIGVVSVTVGLSIGLVLGGIAGYFGGMSDTIIMRCMDVMLSIPSLLLAIGIVAVLGFNLIGDGLREALDPKLRGR